MKMIVGLGNPGKDYEKTRHNIGFMCVDNYVDNSNWKEKFNAMYQQIIVNNEKVLIVKPLTYMNLSGNAVRKFVEYYNININDILVIQDDLDLPVGQIRLKMKSSAGGHNGIKSIIDNLGSNEFARLKIGIAKDSGKDIKDYVLGKFTLEELERVDKSVGLSKEIINYYLINDIEKTMNIYNKN